MISNSDFEKLWFLYKTEGESKGVSINAFCLSRGVNYNEFNKWFRKMHKSIVPVEIEGAPAGDSQEAVKPAEESGCIDVNPRKKGIHVFIHTSDGLQIQKKGLSYQELVKLVFRDNNPVYKIDWKSLVAVLESPVIKSISLQ